MIQIRHILLTFVLGIIIILKGITDTNTYKIDKQDFGEISQKLGLVKGKIHDTSPPEQTKPEAFWVSKQGNVMFCFRHKGQSTCSNMDDKIKEVITSGDKSRVYAVGTLYEVL